MQVYCLKPALVIPYLMQVYASSVVFSRLKLILVVFSQHSNGEQASKLDQQK